MANIYQLMVERAREQIAGRLAYWQSKDVQDSTAKACVVANLEWALMQLDVAPGYIAALQAQSPAAREAQGANANPTSADGENSK